MLEPLREWWENFSYSLEEKGIPPWIVPLGLIVVLAIGLLFLFGGKPPGGSVLIKTYAASGEPIENALVTLDGEKYSQTESTNAEGIASFDNVPEGDYSISVSSAQFAFPDAGRFSLSVVAGSQSEKTVYSEPSVSNRVSL